MIVEITKCDLCGDDGESNQSIFSHVYGIAGEKDGESCQMELNSRTTEDDSFHACGYCLQKLHAKIGEVLKLDS